MRTLLIIALALLGGLFTCLPLTAGAPLAESKARGTAQVVSVQGSYMIEPLASNVFAAIAKPGGKASTNALFAIGR